MVQTRASQTPMKSVQRMLPGARWRRAIEEGVAWRAVSALRVTERDFL